MAFDESQLNIENILWEAKPLLRKAEEWEKGMQCVKFLCQVGQITQWLDGKQGSDRYRHIPYHYLVEGIEIEFLPHWSYCTVGGRDFPIPTSRQDLLTMIRLAKTGEQHP